MLYSAIYFSRILYIAHFVLYNSSFFDDFCATIYAVGFYGTLKNCYHRYRILFVPVEILLIECRNSQHVCREFWEEYPMKILQPTLCDNHLQPTLCDNHLQPTLCDNHFRICRGLFFLHFVIF